MCVNGTGILNSWLKRNIASSGIAYDDMNKTAGEIPVGSDIEIQYTRDKTQFTAIIKTEQRGKFEGNEFECESWGLSVEELTPRIIKNLRLKDDKGVLVSGVRTGSIADEVDIFRGNVIRYIDDTEIEDLDHFKHIYKTLETLPEKGVMLRLVYRNVTHFGLLKE